MERVRAIPAMRLASQKKKGAARAGLALEHDDLLQVVVRVPAVPPGLDTCQKAARFGLRFLYVPADQRPQQLTSGPGEPAAVPAADGVDVVAQAEEKGRARLAGRYFFVLVALHCRS